MPVWTYAAGTGTIYTVVEEALKRTDKPYIETHPGVAAFTIAAKYIFVVIQLEGVGDYAPAHLVALDTDGNEIWRRELRDQEKSGKVPKNAQNFSSAYDIIEVDQQCAAPESATPCGKLLTVSYKAQLWVFNYEGTPLPQHSEEARGSIRALSRTKAGIFESRGSKATDPVNHLEYSVNSYGDIGGPKQGELVAKDEKTGQLVWRSQKLEGYFGPPPVVANGRVYVAPFAGREGSRLYAFDSRP